MVRKTSDATPASSATTRSSGESTEELLRRYRRSGAPTLMARVIERHQADVAAMASGLATRLPRSVDPQDLVHAGLQGLMQAIEVYEPDRCDQFSAFMRIRVRGAMLDELRQLDFVPRLARRRLRERDHVRAQLRMQLEREPTDSELAQALGITEEALARRFEPVVLHSTASTDGGDDQFEQLADDGVESPADALDRQELVARIEALLEPLEWKVLRLLYLEGLTGKQVARKVRLSPSRICQIHGRVLAALKSRLSPEPAQ
jgi:RNA polymerase sigma factor FliA